MKNQTSVKNENFLSTFKGKLAFMASTISAMVIGVHTNAFAATGALKNAGITKGSLDGAGKDSLFGSLQNIVYLIMGIGGLWAVAWIIIGGMLLSGSGSNANKRTAGIGAIFVAAVGAYVIYKAYTIAGWAVGIAG